MRNGNSSGEMRVVLRWGSTGLGAAMGIGLLQLLGAQPQLFFELVRSWGTQVPLLVLFGFVSLRGLSAMREHAAAQTAMAGAVERANSTQESVATSVHTLAHSVGEMAARDNDQVTRMQLEIGHTMRSVARVEEGQKEIVKMLQDLRPL